MKRAKLERKEDIGVDIISIAIKAGEFVPEESLVDQMMTFLVAGHETTSLAVQWAIYLLCKNPEIQSRLRKEIRSKLPSEFDIDNVDITSTLDSSPFLHAVCNEVLRVYSPVPLVVRVAAKDTSLNNIPIPKGTRVTHSPWAANYSRELWGEDASEFNPDRWTGPGKANTGGARSNYAFGTFSHGPRSCIGSHFAKAEFACILAALVATFEIELEKPDDEVLTGSRLARPIYGIRVRLTIIDE